jgi:hypothetical protein
MFRQSNEFNLENLKLLKHDMLLLEKFDPIKTPVLTAVLNYYISVMENRNLVGLTFTNFNERESDARFILDKMKLNNHDFINIVGGYVAAKNDSSEFKQLITKVLNTAKISLAVEEERQEKTLLILNMMAGVGFLGTFASKDTEGDISERLSRILLLAASMLALYTINKYARAIFDVIGNVPEGNQNTNAPQLRRP